MRGAVAQIGRQDSGWGFSMVATLHEQTDAAEICDQELAGL